MRKGLCTEAEAMALIEGVWRCACEVFCLQGRWRVNAAIAQCRPAWTNIVDAPAHFGDGVIAGA